MTSFVDPRQAFGPDKVIPPEILAGAKVRRVLPWRGVAKKTLMSADT